MDLLNSAKLFPPVMQANFDEKSLEFRRLRMLANEKITEMFRAYLFASHFVVCFGQRPVSVALRMLFSLQTIND